VVLIPTGDPLKDHIDYRCTVFEGDEHNVLDRYAQAADFFDSDYICRITGDCPWVSPFVIQKAIRAAIFRHADYTSNVLVRTFIEGQDTEVLSKRLLEWIVKNAKDSAFHQEHVTTLVNEVINQKRLPPEYTVHTLLNTFDTSHIKTSVDTQEEYDQSLEWLREYEAKKNLAKNWGSISS
jgi:spore coat polysaccharide biosynthesis protein SpsF (cytidylyltransferase family)